MERLDLCRKMANGDPRIKITAFESDLPSAYTAATLAFLKMRYQRRPFRMVDGG